MKYTISVVTTSLIINVLLTLISETNTLSKLSVHSNSYLNDNNLYNFNIRDEEFIKETDIKIKALKDKLYLEELERQRIEQERIEQELQLLKEKEAEINRIKSVNFNEYNLLEVSNIKAEELYEILPESMKHLAWAIVDTENIYGVSSLFTTSIIALESSWATSRRAMEENNLSGMAVYGDESVGIIYSSQVECVYDTARQLKENYLSPDGMFHNGYSTYDVNIKYCASKDWYLKVNQIAYELLEKYNVKYKYSL